MPAGFIRLRAGESPDDRFPDDTAATTPRAARAGAAVPMAMAVPTLLLAASDCRWTGHRS